jgi:benzoyl-CoA 2,3-epoxidase subunit B
VPAVEAGAATERSVPALSALNNTLRNDYIDDCQNGLERWNRTLAPAGAALRLPHVGFHRAVGVFSGHHFTPEGLPVTAEEWSAGHDRWLPTEDDRAHVASLMGPVTETGRVAGWLAPPASGIHAKPADFEYVQL